MKKPNFKRQLAKIPQFLTVSFLFRWLVISGMIAAIVGSVSAFFLVSLDWVTNFRESHVWIIALLPIAGLAVGSLYHFFGSDVVKGNNQLLEEFHSPKKVIPLKMAPLVLIGTLLTHLFGGSAGREGTAVQMGAAISDQFTKIFRLKRRDRRILITVGISAGFASVFGTPLAGAVFALEIMMFRNMRYETIAPSFFAAFVADFVCRFWNVGHTHYFVPDVPEISAEGLGWTIFVGILFGLSALSFSKILHFISRLFSDKIKFPPFRPMIGGIFIAVFVFSVGSTKYIGLGIPTILEAFQYQLPRYDFAVKILITAFTLGVGFKGGEVTPLFFIGATLGNALFLFVPLPVALLAAMGFVAVFSGATNTPIACTLMGIELFGLECGIYLGIACFVAYLFSGKTGIYSSQEVGNAKHRVYARLSGRRPKAL